MGEVTPPAILNPSHETSEFSSGNETLDSWLDKIALQAGYSNTSRTFVVCASTEPKRVIGYYSISSASLATIDALDRIKQGTGRHPIPVVKIARLAVDSKWQGSGLGAALVFDAVRRIKRLQDELGVRAIVVQAIDDQAKEFYEHLGFRSSQFNPRLLMALLKDVRPK
ncbi:MAG: GNAT family N-acetyltransferase [Actinomycetota bacterium]